MRHDLSGDVITVESDAVRDAWNAMIEGVLAHAAATPDHLAKALSEDPHFALAHAAKGLMLLSLARSEFVQPASTCLAAARDAMARRPVTWREAMYADALADWLSDQPRRAAVRLESILDSHPTDALALKIAHGLRFMLGDQPEMLATLRRVTPHFGDHHPLAGFVNGCFAFALEERGLYAEAEVAGRHAVALAPRDAWGRHAVAHVLEMTGRAEEGVSWLGDAACWAHANNLRFHIVWHLALFHLERGDIAEVLRLYDHDIRATPTDDFRDIANGASLLARLEFEGIDVGCRWEELAERAQGRIEDGRLVFADLHYTLSLLGAGNWDGAEALARNLLRDSRLHPCAERREAAMKGAAAAFGLLAFREGDYAEAAYLLGEARRSLVVIGGSHAQRDLFEQAHIEALIRSGNLEAANTALSDRLARRGGHNAYAARRLARIGARDLKRTAALAVASTPIARAH